MMNIRLLAVVPGYNFDDLRCVIGAIVRLEIFDAIIG